MTHGVKDEEETNHIHTLSRTHRHHHHHHQHTQCKSTIVRSSNHRIITDYSLIDFIAEAHNTQRQSIGRHKHELIILKKSFLSIIIISTALLYLLFIHCTI